MFSLSVVIFSFRYKSIQIQILLSNKTAWKLPGLTIILLSLNQFMAQTFWIPKYFQDHFRSWQNLTRYYHLRNYEQVHYTRKKKSLKKILVWKLNTTIWFDKSIYCDKLWFQNAWKISSIHLIFHSILFSVTLQPLRSLWEQHPMKNLVEFFCLFWLSVYMQKISVIQSFHQRYMLKAFQL